MISICLLGDFGGFSYCVLMIFRYPASSVVVSDRLSCPWFLSDQQLREVSSERCSFAGDSGKEIARISSVGRVNLDWSLFQLDFKNLFLHGDLLEEVYIKQPAGFVDEEY